MNRGRVVLAMSGGVDSSVCAHLLARKGYEVIGLFMRTGAVAEESFSRSNSCARKIRGCCSAVDAGDAQRIADRLDIPFYSLDFAADFDRIKDYFVDEYAQGRTPNPCVVCNTWLKFGKLWEYAEAASADYIATGHYARIEHSDKKFELHRGNDLGKDQSYFLFGLRREILSRVLFPVGEMDKSQVRSIAKQLGLEVHDKPDSQEICFVPDGKYQNFILRHRPEANDSAGQIVDPEGRVLATHQGISGFTIGQRKGLGVAVGEPRHVIQIQPQRNRVVIGPREMLQRQTFEVERVNWLFAEPASGPISCEVKIRHRHDASSAVLEPLAPDRVRVRFRSPQSAITPGQAAVFYEGSRVLGGGWIR